jgi:hypothetical protein
MTTCTFCDQRNAAGRKHCEKCGAELPGAAAARPAPAEPPSGLERELLELVRSQGKIAAIKRYREATGQGLKESKDAVELLAAAHGIESPGGSGCATVLAACLALVSLVCSAIVAGNGRWLW